MKTTLIAAASAIAAATLTTGALTLTAFAHPTRPAADGAQTLAAEGNALFKARGEPWYLSSGTEHTTVTCVQETQVSYYCTNGLRLLGKPSEILSEFFVHVSGDTATWNAISVATLSEGSEGGRGGSGGIWTPPSSL